MAHKVMCRVCREYFDTEQLSQEEWVMPQPRWYYHKKCYNEWIKDQSSINSEGYQDDTWKELMIDYLYKDIKMSVDFVKVNSQWNNFLKSKNPVMTARGIYFGVLYFYQVKHGSPEKAEGGIGIVPSIYAESYNYWKRLEDNKKGTLEAIVQEMVARSNRPAIKIIKKKKEKQDKSRYSLDEV